MEDFVVPVGVFAADERFLGVGAVFVVNIDELVPRKHVGFLGYKRYGIVGVEVDLHLVLRAFFGIDDDDTVGSTATVDSGSRSIFEDGESLDISRVNHREGVGSTLDTVVIHSQTIDDDQRVVGSIQR